MEDVINNIDKDIEILKKLTEKCNACKFATCEQCEINWTQIQAISNVVSELESYKGKIIHLSDEEYNKVIENAQKDIKKELETYKKIAKKLAKYGVNCAYGIPVKFKDTDELMAIVREEVENETNKARFKNT